MATYGTDLALLATGSDADGSGTWVELADYAGGGSAAQDGENRIQGVDCVSQTTGNKTGMQFSIAFDAGSNIYSSFATGDCIFMWQYFAVPEAIDTIANSGLQLAVASTNAGTDAMNRWDVGGSDFNKNPYGGWANVVVDPASTPDNTNNGGAGTTWRYFGSIVNILSGSAITKGTPHAVDAIRYGRGEIYCTGTACTFTGMAQYNDYNDATNGYNRYGLFQATGGGTYLWKGLMSLGQTATSATFSDSNKAITIDYAEKTYAAFNKIEVNNSSTSVTWNNISFFSKSTLSPGQFEMIDNATVAMSGCSFNNMDTFVFQSNATVTDCKFNGCGQVTHGGADFDGCDFAGYEGTAGTAYLTYAVNADPDGELDNCSFTKGTASTHAIEFDATNTPTTITLRGIDFSGYNASNGQNDSTLYFPSTTKSYTVNLIGCTGNISYRVGSGGSVTLVINPVSFTVTVLDQVTKAAIQYAWVTIWATATGNLPYQDSVSITSSGTTATVSHSAHGLSTNQWVEIAGCTQTEYNGIWQITKIDDNSYSYTFPGSGTSPATGSPISTAIIVNGQTNASGVISDQRSYTADQGYNGKVLKGSWEPVYKENPQSGTLDKDTGVSLTALMIRD